MHDDSCSSTAVRRLPSTTTSAASVDSLAIRMDVRCQRSSKPDEFSTLVDALGSGTGFRGS